MNIFFRPEEAMSDNWQKLVSLYKNLFCSWEILNYILSKQNEKHPLTSCSLFDWLYVLSTIDMFIVAFSSAMVDLGNNILKILYNIKFMSLPISILYASFVLFLLVLHSNIVNITDSMLSNVKVCILTGSELLFSTQLGMAIGTSSFLCTSCICLGC